MDYHIKEFENELTKDVFTQLIPLFDYDEKRLEMVCETHYLSASEEDIMIAGKRFNADDNRRYLLVIMFIRRIVKAILDLLPSEIEDKRVKKEVDDIRKEYSEIYSVFDKLSCGLKEDLKDGIELDIPDYSFFMGACLVLPFWFVVYLHIYDYFYGSGKNKNDSEELLNTIKQMSAMLSLCGQGINNMSKQIKNNQKETNDNQKELKKLIINRNKVDEEKTGTLSVEQCVVLIYKVKQKYYNEMLRDCLDAGIPPETLKKVSERTIRRYVEFWDQYLNGNKKQGRKPPRTDYSRNMSMEEYTKLINDVECDKYYKWRAKNKIVLLTQKKTRRFNDR